MDGDIVTLFRILRDREIGPELARQIYLTPFSRQEYELSYQPANNSLEQARRTIVRSFMGFSSDSVTRNFKTGFRSVTKNSVRNAAREWINYPENLMKIIERLREVIIENLPALECMAKFDSLRTLHYIDPPYLIELYYKENGKMNYRYEMSREDHVELLKFIKELKGMVIISHYPNDLYEEILRDWKRVETLAITQSSGNNGKNWKHETEVLWISPNAVKRLPLFDDLNSKPIEIGNENSTFPLSK